MRFDDERLDPQAFEDLIVVARSSGGTIRLGDIARITDQFENDDQRVTFNGAQAALLQISRTKQQDTLDVMANLKSFLRTERGHAPPGVTLEITKDVASIVEDRLSMLSRNGAQGLALVFLSMWLFFSFRYSFWIAMGLPVSFLGALWAMSAIGYSLNMITMVGLLIAIGLLMDDAIVISENIAAKLAKGMRPLEAAVNGAQQVMPGILSSFLTTICIFGALAFMEGTIGQIMRVMPVVLILTLTVSLVEAFLILPSHLYHSLHHIDTREPSRFRQAFEAGFEGFRQRLVRPLIDLSVQYRYLTVGLCLMLLMGSMSMIVGGQLKFRAFPAIEGDVIEARLLLPQGTPEHRTRRAVEQLGESLATVDAALSADLPEGKRLVRNVTIQYGTNKDSYEAGVHQATMVIDLLSNGERRVRVDDVMAAWRQATPPLENVISLKFAEGQLGPAGKDIEFRLIGSDLDQLKAASTDLQAWLKGYDGVTNILDDLRPGKPELRLYLRDEARALGFSAQNIATQIGTALQGRTISEIQVGPEAYEIDVRLSREDRDSLGDLDDFFVAAADGTSVPLSTVAAIAESTGYARIHRINGTRAVTITGSVDARIANASEVVGHTQQSFLPGLLETYPGIVSDTEGQSKETAKTGRSILTNFAMGLLGVFLILSFQFRSYVEPVTVMAAIPLGLVGMVIGHMVQGLDLSMPSMVGMASLAGVVVNNSILLITFVKEHRKHGQSAAEASKLASLERFRPILLTAMTTVLGLTPLLAETSLQAQIMIPLATSLAFGLTSATVLALFLVPALYTIFDDFGWVADPAAPTEEEDNEVVPVSG